MKEGDKIIIEVNDTDQKPEAEIYSFFIGRFQPLHDGHKAIIENLLKEDKLVCVAIRKTKISNVNPYTEADRYQMIRKAFPDPDKVKIITIPDIAELVYGRDVGYHIRKLRLDPETESISGTKIRGKSG